MAKYRGQHEGKTRGKYLRTAFESIQNSRDENYKLKRRLGDFFLQRGDLIVKGEYSHEDSYDFVSSYHMGGASVGLNIWGSESESVGYYDPPFHLATIKLVSNEGLDDIAKMILNAFPSFREYSPTRIKYNPPIMVLKTKW